MPVEITSPHNPRVKAARQLRERKGRQRQGRILIDGARELIRAIGAGVELVEVFVCGELCQGDECRQALAAIARTRAERLDVTPGVFGKLAFGDRADGLLGVAATPRRTLDDLRLPADPLVAVLAGVEKPGNVGAVLRSADGAGLAAVIVADGGTDLFNPNTIRASLGTIFTLPVVAADADETIAWLRARSIRLFAARVEGAVPYTSVDLRGPAAIVLGSEAAGLSDEWTGPDVTAVLLPMRGAADSLNVSAAAAVLFYEALRQRTIRS
jgi:TrmH family RNA methyltransferase